MRYHPHPHPQPRARDLIQAALGLLLILAQTFAPLAHHHHGEGTRSTSSTASAVLEAPGDDGPCPLCWMATIGQDADVADAAPTPAPSPIVAARIVTDHSSNRFVHAFAAPLARGPPSRSWQS